MNIDYAMQLKEVKLLNKQNHICSNILVFSVLCMHYKVSKDTHSYILQSLLDLQTFQVLQGLYSALFLTMHLIFG